MDDDDLLALSGLQHFAFCPRQWALIHVEGQWADNLHTVEGELFHQRVHDETSAEQRSDLLIVRGLRVFSHRLGVTGQCDVVEFRRDPQGITLAGRAGSWLPCPVEYKKGKPKEHNADALQLCCQAMCLEEMLCCHIKEGDLFYGQPRRRQKVEFTDELRQHICQMLESMHDLMQRGHTPRAKVTKACAACSLREICLPRLEKTSSVAAYLKSRLKEESYAPDA